MSDAELRNDVAVRGALRAAFLSVGMRPQGDSDGALLNKLSELGVVADMSLGYLRLTQGATEISLSAACERLRKELPTLFAADPKRDAIASREDLERGTAAEVAHAKSAWISKHGLSAWESLPKTRAEAERKNAPINPDMTRSQWLSLPFAERSRMAGIFDAATIGKIMSRRG